MIRALGYSETAFDPRDPGRLCRGRERWIEPWEDDVPEGAPDGAVPDGGPARPASRAPIARTVVSGATFSDDGAADARRGAAWSGVDCAAVIEALFPGRRLFGFMEDGHPADIPARAEGVELYDGYRAGGRQELPLVRWHVVATGPDAVRELVGEGPEERIRGFAVLPRGADLEALRDAVFPLVGFSSLDSPPARFQPMALPDLLERVEAVILLHRDKHGPAVAVYSREPLPEVAERLRAAVDARAPGALLVPFAIPPMLARWDRALAELRAGWTGPGEFPVPKGPPQPAESRFHRRRRRRWSGDPDDGPAALGEEGLEDGGLEDVGPDGLADDLPEDPPDGAPDEELPDGELRDEDGDPDGLDDEDVAPGDDDGSDEDAGDEGADEE